MITRLAPSPTGYLHLGHAQTFRTTWEIARHTAGRVILRIEDIDTVRCRPQFISAIEEDLRWIGLDWDEGPYLQSQRRSLYFNALAQLWQQGLIYPCRCSRRDVLSALSAPHQGDEEPPYPGTCRPATPEIPATGQSFSSLFAQKQDHHWRFRVPDGEALTFSDQRLGPQNAITGRDFGDFVLWRRDDCPAYQLAVVVDDLAMKITHVIRGEDLLFSTFRQLLLYRAFLQSPPHFHHTALICDPETGQRLAKRHASLSLRTLRAQGVSPESLFLPPPSAD